MSGAGPQRLLVSPGGVLRGELAVPGDKSISHRALILTALADGPSRIRGILDAADTRATARALAALGVDIRRAGGALTVSGVGPGGLRPPEAVLDLGNAGTGLRLLAGVLAGQPFASTLTGDASLRRRPMGRIIEPLRAMGAQITPHSGGTAPLVIRPARLQGIDYRLPVASAQVKSALLLAGLFAAGETRVEDPYGTRDHTERLLADLGAPLGREGDAVTVAGGAVLRPGQLHVPGDLSSAAFLLAGAAMRRGSQVTLEGVGVNPGRDGVLEVLRRMGADVAVRPVAKAGAEPVADITVRGGMLQGARVEAALVPRTVDEYPILFVAAAAARGRSVFEGLGELRFKESDRIAVMARALSALGVRVEVAGDRVTVHGGQLRGGRVDSGGDHRCAMALVMAGLVAQDEIVVDNCAQIATSFPGFVDSAGALGLGVSAAA